METVEDASAPNATVEGVKPNVSSEPAALIAELDVCKKSNGVAESGDAPISVLVPKDVEASDTQCTSGEHGNVGDIDSQNDLNELNADENREVITTATILNTTLSSVAEQESADTSSVTVQDVEVNTKHVSLSETDVPKNEDTANKPAVQCNNIEIFHNDNVTFETEILVETNDNDINEMNLNDTKTEDGIQGSPNNILNELGQNLELSEALRSSDTAENGENNNHTVGQEVFNKEELLDILEGNDIQPTSYNIEFELDIDVPKAKELEAQLALQQLSRLKKKKKKTKSTDIGLKKKTTSADIGLRKKTAITDNPRKSTTPVKAKAELPVTSDPKKDDSIVNVLVKDWDDDEPCDEQTENLEEKSNSLLNLSEEVIKSQDSIVSQDVTIERTSIDSTGETPNSNKNNEDNQPQRRLGRVIKKKVIFDPDNPDTFTKNKMTNKNKESQTDKEEPPSKKGKIEQVIHRAKSKSPVSKSQWKKPPPKNSKQNKRLTEVDKLLMDEGAVNMIYQLTPEAPKGKKNMKTKAEFIKKLQSSTPESKEMKFRERKKETGKGEEGEAKKILGGKQRSSLSSSVKDSACEDYETHSADDSIIYRRHSSSSYSSTCMSPRRLSDVETGSHQSAQTKVASVKGTDTPEPDRMEDNSANLSSEVFMPDEINASSSDIINKNDCLSIKEKLNSKLSLALNKRKREISKTDKPVKQKKLFKSDEKSKLIEVAYKHLTVALNQRVAEICIRTTGSMHTVEMFNELQQALVFVDSRKDISVTLLISECGKLCSELQLRPLLEDDKEKRMNSALDLAEAIRSVLWTVSQHSKLVMVGVWGVCSGVALALLALCDVALAAEDARFVLPSASVLPPGLALLAANRRPLASSLINDLVIFGRELTASDALHGGLVSRVLWPERFLDQLRNIVKDVAAQPVSNILLKKRLLNLKSSSDNTFLSCLDKERDLIVEYWTSREGQQLLRATISDD